MPRDSHEAMIRNNTDAQTSQVAMRCIKSQPDPRVQTDSDPGVS